MSRSPFISEDLDKVATLVQRGNLPAARREMGSLMRFVDPETRTLIGRCVATLETYPFSVAAPKLHHAADHADDPHDRAVIIAFTPENDPGLFQRPAEPARNGREFYRAPRNSRRRIDPSRRKAQRTERQARQDAAATRYVTERGGVAEGPQLPDRDQRARDAQVYASGLDYDKAGIPDTRGLPCLACWVERATADATTDRVRAGHGDDGLCTECRESARPGIPELPTGHTPADAVAARCAYIVARTGASARGILGREWQRAGRASQRRALIAAWVQAHPLPDTAAPAEQPTEDTTPAAAVDGACDQCGGIRQVRHGLCLDCRQLDTAPVPDATPSATADEPAASEPEPAPLAA